MKKYLLFAVFCSTLGLVKAQTSSLYLEGFEGSATALPTGWVSSPAPGWEVSSSNSSTGYTGAGGGNSVKIDNQDVATGTYSLATKAVSTVGYGSVTVSWGARLTTNFPPSTIAPMVYYSTNNGTTWNGVSYTEMSSGSTWKLNGPIAMPSAVDNQAAVMFQLVANVTAGASGTYRIDDFEVKGTTIPTNTNVVTGIKTNAAAQMPESFVADRNLYFNVKDQAAPVNAVKVYDITGKEVISRSFNRETQSAISLADLNGGIYLIRFELSNGQLFTKKTILY